MEETENGDASHGDATSEPCKYTLELQKCLKDIVQKILRNMSEEKFIQLYKDCYKEFEKKNKIEKPALSGSSSEAKKYQTQFHSMVSKSVFATIDQTVMGINHYLKELEELKEGQEGSAVFWRPPGNALKHMEIFDNLCEIDMKTELQCKIRKEQENLTLLKSRLAQKRRKAREHHDTIQKSTSHIQNEVSKPKNMVATD